MRLHSDICHRCVEYVSRDLDGDLAEFEQALLRAHVASCEECRLMQERMTEQTRALRSTALEPIPRPIALPTARRIRPFQVTAAAVAAAVAGLVSFGLLERVGERGVATRALPSISADVQEQILMERHLRVLKTTGTQPAKAASPRVRRVFLPFENGSAGATLAE
jgi:anti-sigma factor RsiW